MRWPWQKDMDDHKEEHEIEKKEDNREKEEISLRVARVRRRLKALEARVNQEGK